jgi:hypothetical protein
MMLEIALAGRRAFIRSCGTFRMNAVRLGFAPVLGRRGVVLGPGGDPSRSACRRTVPPLSRSIAGLLATSSRR